jgi:alpha-1,6-mannosyltransferase
VWRSTTSPYGPLFIESSRLLAAGSAGSLIGAVMAFRAFELVGVALVMFFLPRLARQLGTDPGIALWLGVLSPLALFSFIASGHNDALLVGLLVAGVSLAVEGRLAWGFALCAAAATVKLPALAAIVFLAVDGFCSRASGRRWRVVIEAVAITAAVFVSATLIAGYGWAWLGPSALRVPTKLRLLSTPSVSLGVLVFHILHPLGVGSARSSIVTATEYVVGVGAALGTVWLLATVRRHEIVRSLGLALLLIVVGSPTLWPWYLMWGLVLLAATTAQRSRAVAAAAALAMLVVGPSGSPRLLGWSYVIVSLAVAAACVWLVRHRRWHRVVVGNGA